MVSRLTLIAATFTGSDATTLTSQYGTTVSANGSEIKSNGYDAVASETLPAINCDIFTPSSTPDVDKRPTLHANQWATVKIVSSALRTPNVHVRASYSTNLASYWVHSGNSAASRTVVRSQSGTNTVLAAGGSGTPSGGDTLEIEIQGTAIRAGRNGVSEISTSDSAITTGDIGCGGGTRQAAAGGDDLFGGILDFYVPTVRRPNRLPLIRKAQKNQLEEDFWKYVGS